MDGLDEEPGLARDVLRHEVGKPQEQRRESLNGHALAIRKDPLSGVERGFVDEPLADPGIHGSPPHPDNLAVGAAPHVPLDVQRDPVGPVVRETKAIEAPSFHEDCAPPFPEAAAPISDLNGRAPLPHQLQEADEREDRHPTRATRQGGDPGIPVQHAQHDPSAGGLGQPEHVPVGDLADEDRAQRLLRRRLSAG